VNTAGLHVHVYKEQIVNTAGTYTCVHRTGREYSNTVLHIHAYTEQIVNTAGLHVHEYIKQIVKTVIQGYMYMRT